MRSEPRGGYVSAASVGRALGAIAAVTLVTAMGFAAASCLRLVFAGPTPLSYAAGIGTAARFVRAGDLSFDGEHFSCGRSPTVFNPSFSDYGAAFFGFIVLNPERFGLLPLSLKRFAYAHECGHQYVGYSERAADCYAVQRGLSAGWLDAKSMDEVCAFFSRSKGSVLHLPGPQRCAAIRSCYLRHGGKASRSLSIREFSPTATLAYN